MEHIFSHKDKSVAGTSILLYSQLAQGYLIYQMYDMPILQEHERCTDPHQKPEGSTAVI
jgi:hypothetical protein